MKTRMTHAARAELVEVVRSRYSAASGKAKRRLLDEFIAASGYHEKSAIRVSCPNTAALGGRGCGVRRRSHRCTRLYPALPGASHTVHRNMVSARNVDPHCYRRVARSTAVALVKSEKLIQRRRAAHTL
jgi:hypothetical protein